MSISIYYTATRSASLSADERAVIDALIEEFSVDDEIQEYLNTRQGLNWESFCVYDPNDPTEAGVIFEGATKLPDNSDVAIWRGLEHWSRLLSRIRRAVPGARWHVHVDDNDLVWDDSAAEYDLSQSTR
jgi:hypothetical protein